MVIGKVYVGMEISVEAEVVIGINNGKLWKLFYFNFSVATDQRKWWKLKGQFLRRTEERKNK